jgi:hypothetical protein
LNQQNASHGEKKNAFDAQPLSTNEPYIAFPPIAVFYTYMQCQTKIIFVLSKFVFFLFLDEFFFKK